jgi:hypothetical protein
VAAGGADGILAEHGSARLGIVNEVAAKAKLWKSVQEAIDEKSADLLVGWQPPLLSKTADYEFVGPLPLELQDPKHSTWTAFAATKAADLERAKAFTQMLASPESLGVFKRGSSRPERTKLIRTGQHLRRGGRVRAQAEALAAALRRPVSVQ